MPDDTSCLLSLPEAVLREVISWSPDGSTANALLDACRTLQRQRRDPAAAALLLLRCPCQYYPTALMLCARSCGGCAAVVEQLIQLTGASPDSGGPNAAPPLLLQAALDVAVVSGDHPTIRALMASRQPPDINAGSGQAALLALVHCEHSGQVSSLQALLDCGADPCNADWRLFSQASMRPSTVPALQLLLQHCPAHQRPAAMIHVATTAVGSQNLVALELLLALPEAAVVSWPPSLVLQAARAGHTAALRLFVDHSPCSQKHLSRGLMLAADHGHCACADLLLDRGAGAAHGAEVALLSVFTEPSWPLPAGTAAVSVADGTVHDMVQLLLRRGAPATHEVWAAAELAGHGRLLAALVAEVEAEAAAGEL